MGAHDRRKALENDFVVHLHFSGSTSTISRFGERFFVMVELYYSVTLLFAVLLLTVPPVPSLAHL